MEQATNCKLIATSLVNFAALNGSARKGKTRNASEGKGESEDPGWIWCLTTKPFGPELACIACKSETVQPEVEEAAMSVEFRIKQMAADPLDEERNSWRNFAQKSAKLKLRNESVSSSSPTRSPHLSKTRSTHM